MKRSVCYSAGVAMFMQLGRNFTHAADAGASIIAITSLHENV